MPQLETEFTREQLEQAGRVNRRLLRSCGRLEGVHEDLIQAIQPGRAVHSPRRTGKTSTLLYLVDFREHGNAIVVGMNEQMANDLRDKYRQLKYSGKPKFTSADRILDHWGDGHTLPFYCDEFWLFSESAKTWLSRSGRVGGAIGTARDGVSNSAQNRGSDLIADLMVYPL